MSMYGDKNSDPFFAELISKISQDIPVSVARYGDGEVMCAIAVRKGRGYKCRRGQIQSQPRQTFD